MNAEAIAIEELRGYVSPDIHPQLHDLLGQLYLVDLGPGNTSRYFPKAWVARFADDIKERTGEDIATLYGKLTVIDIAALLSSESNPHTALLQVTLDYESWRKEQGTDYRVYTMTTDYMATGEGRTLHFVAGHAPTMAEFLAAAVPKVGAYFSLGAEVFEGVPPTDNAAAQLLLTQPLREFLEGEPKCSLDTHLYAHFNFS